MLAEFNLSLIWQLIW